MQNKGQLSMMMRQSQKNLHSSKLHDNQEFKTGSEMRKAFMKQQDVSSTNTLSTDMFKNMLRLEEKIKEKEGNNNDLAELISYYGKCVEFYDKKKDNVKYYFLEKIQHHLADQHALSILLSGTTTPRDSVRSSFNFSSMNQSIDFKFQQSAQKQQKQFIQESDDEDDMEINQIMTDFRSPLKNIDISNKNTDTSYINNKSMIQRNNFVEQDKQQKDKENKSRGYSIGKKKVERATKLTIFMDVQENNPIYDIPNMLNQMKVIDERNDKIINTDLDNQLQNFKSLLQQKISQNQISQKIDKDLSQTLQQKIQQQKFEQSKKSQDHSLSQIDISKLQVDLSKSSSDVFKKKSIISKQLQKKSNRYL